MASADMAARSLRARGQPIRLNGKGGTVDTFGIPYRDETGDEMATHHDLSVTIAANVPVVERDNALFAGRDYVVRSVAGGGGVLKQLRLQLK